MNIFKEAEKIVNGERYGVPENNFETIAALWTAYLGKGVSAEDVANMMILLKVARNKSGHGKSDNYIDICGYAHFGNKFAEAIAAYFERIGEENKGYKMKATIYKADNVSEVGADKDNYTPLFKNTKGAREMMMDRKRHNITHCQTCLHKEVTAGEPCNDCAVINFGKNGYYAKKDFEIEKGTR